jgi:hypothetical protein
MVVFPPYMVVNGYHVITMSGYGFLFNPHLYTDKGIAPASVNTSTLLAQIVGILIVGTLLFFALRYNKSRL